MHFPNDSNETDQLAAFFAGHETARAIFEAIYGALKDLGPLEVRVSKSQVAFRHPNPARRATIAIVWVPEQYLRRPAAPLVLTFSFRQRDSSPRWKEIVEPAPGRFTHHLELATPAEVDDQVVAWLRAAWDAAKTT